MTQMSARDRILSRIRQPDRIPVSAPEDWSIVERSADTTEHLLAQFTEKLTSVKGEVIQVSRAQGDPALAGAILEWMTTAGHQRLLTGTSELADQLTPWLSEQLTVTRYDSAIETRKDALFDETKNPVGLTGSKALIAETGSVICWPDATEPRTLSLVPTVHLCVADAQMLFPNLHTFISQQQVAEHLPTNALMISGPSKSADIAQVLAYGVHGPKRMVVFIRV